MGCIKLSFRYVFLIVFLLKAGLSFGQTIITSQNFDGGGLAYAVSNSNYVKVITGSGVSSTNALQFGNNNGSNDRNSTVTFNSVDISSYSNVTVSISFASYKVGDKENLLLQISYDNGSNYSTVAKLIDGQSNETWSWGTPDNDGGAVTSNPYTFNVPEGNTSIKVRVRSKKLDDDEYFYIDNLSIDGLALPVCTEPTAQPTSLIFTTLIATQIDGKFTASASADSYLVVYNTDGSTPVPADLTYAIGDTIGSSTVVGNDSDTTFSATGLTVNTTYYFYVFSFNGVCSGVPNYLISSPLMANVTTDVYCNPIYSLTDFALINRVQLNTIDNAPLGSGPGTTSLGYSDFTAISTDLEVGSTHTVTITPDWTLWLMLYQGHAVWIDYNQDGDFEDSGEQVMTAGPNLDSTVSGSFTIPANATIGSTRMRVSMKLNGIPLSCETYFHGEVEDYTINIVPKNTGFSEVIVSVDWPLWSTENKVEIYSPDNLLLTTIENGFDNSVSNPNVPYSTTVNLGCLENASNYYIIMYDIGGSVNGPGDGWDSNLPSTVSNITITSGGVTVLSNDGSTVDSGGERVNFIVSGGGACDVSGVSEVVVSVDWPLWSTENKVEIYSPDDELIATIDNGFDASIDSSYSETLNLGCLENAVNYYIIMYDIGSGGAGDGWDSSNPSEIPNVTITSGGATVLSNDGSAVYSGGERVNFIVSGGGACEAPGGVSSNLELWLKANSDVLKGGSNAVDGDEVDDWNDQSGNANNATKAGTSNNATYTNVLHNFNPAVNFINGDNGYFDVNLNAISNSDYNLIAIVQRSANINNNYFLGTTSSSQNTGLHFGFRNNTSATLAQYSNDVDVTVNAFDDPKQSVALLRGELDTSIGKTIYQLREGGADSASDTDVAPLNAPINSGVLGRGYNSSQGFDGYISEVIAYNSTLTSAKLNQIYSYLAIKYGMTLEGDYVNSSGVTIWDATANMAYHNNVTGIGRDDTSVLNQKQSKSEQASGLGDANDDITIGLGSIETTNNLNTNTFTTNTSFLLWGHNNGSVSAGASISIDLSAGISGLTTIVTCTPIQRVWKIVEIETIETTKISIPEAMLSAVSGTDGDYFMLVSSNDTFNESDEFVKLTLNGSNLESAYDFTGTEYVTFGYSPYTVEERSIKFDGVDDYVDMGNVLDLNTSNFTISTWIKGTGTFEKKTILSKRDFPFTEGYELKIGGSNVIHFDYYSSVNRHTLKSTTQIPVGEWHHLSVVYSSGTLSLYIDGIFETSINESAPTATNNSFLIGVAGSPSPNPVSYFSGTIDEVRIWDVALTEGQLRYIMNQEIKEHTDATVTGAIIAQNITKNEVASIDWANLAAYYPMSTYAYPGVLIDDSVNENNGTLKNLNTVDMQTAPLPYKNSNTATANWDVEASWLDGTVGIPNSYGINGLTIIDWNIVSITNTGFAVNTNRGDGNSITLLGLISDTDSELNVTGNTSSDGTGTGELLTISHYLKLDGLLDLEGESQLIQTTGSVLDINSTGILERDQQGTANLYSYNFWGSPVGETKVSGDVAISDYSYALANILYDGSSPVNFVGGYDGSTSPVSIANYWLYKYVDGSGAYAEWISTGSTGPIYAGEGFSMKGTSTGDVATFQNYTFKGLPNNGTISLTVSADNEYLVANPYPSAVDSYKFIDDNSSSLSTGTLYFWQQYQGTSHNLVDYEGGYATLTKGGGVPASIPAAGISPNLPTLSDLKTPEQYIPISQGFFTDSDSDGGNIEFNNGQRFFETEASVGSIFMKSFSLKSKNTILKKGDIRPKFRLGFEAPQIGHRQLLLTIDENTTDAVDWGYDGVMNGVAADDMYWDLADKKYVIQVTDSITDDKEIPLGIVMSETGLAAINIDVLENVDEAVELFIKDALAGTTTKINNQSFEIELEAGEYLDRFSLVFKLNKVDEEEVVEIEEEVAGIEIIVKELFVYMNNSTEELRIYNTTSSVLLGVKLYNNIGQLAGVWTKNLENTLTLLPVNNLATGMYIVQLQTTTGIVTKKVIIE